MHTTQSEATLENTTDHGVPSAYTDCRTSNEPELVPWGAAFNAHRARLTYCQGCGAFSPVCASGRCNRPDWQNRACAAHPSEPAVAEVAGAAACVGCWMSRGTVA